MNRFSLLYIFMSKLFFKTPPGASNSSSDTRTVSTDHNYPKSFIKQIAGTAITFTLEKRNEDFMTGKQNILRPFRNVITLLLLLITFKQMVTTSNGTILTFCRPVKLTTIVKLKRPCLFRSCSYHWMSMSAVNFFYFITKAFLLYHFTDSFLLKRQFLLQMFSV